MEYQMYNTDKTSKWIICLHYIRTFVLFSEHFFNIHVLNQKRNPRYIVIYLS